MSAAAHAVLCRRLRGAGFVGARDLQTDLNFYKSRQPLRKQRDPFEAGGFRQAEHDVHVLHSLT